MHAQLWPTTTAIWDVTAGRKQCFINRSRGLAPKQHHVGNTNLNKNVYHQQGEWKTQGKTSANGNDSTTKCEQNPDDNGNTYVAYIWKRPNQGQKRWVQRGQSIVSINPQKSPQLFVFIPRCLSRRKKKRAFNFFTRKCQKWGWLRKDIVWDNSGTALGQLRDRSGTGRDRCGTGPGQVRDRSGTGPGQVGNFLKFSENFWDFLLLKFSETSEIFWDFLKISEIFRHFLKFSEFFGLCIFQLRFGDLLFILAPHNGVPGRLAKIWFWVVGVLRFPLQSSLSSLASPCFCFLAPNHHPVLLPCPCVLPYHPTFFALAAPPIPIVDR